MTNLHHTSLHLCSYHVQPILYKFWHPIFLRQSAVQERQGTVKIEDSIVMLALWHLTRELYK